MQPTEAFSVPRRTLDVEDYIDILRRHKGWIFGPFLLTLVASVVGVYLWPDTYVSTASIKITPQQISTLLIPDVSNQDIVERIDALQSQVLSRSELTNLMRSLNLYPREKEKMAPEDVLDLMRKSIKLESLGTAATMGNGRSVAAFQISFRYPNRFEANKVVQALVSKFTDESSRVRSRQTYQQTEFTRSQFEESKKKLDDVDAKITEFKLANPGKLPEQMGANMSAMASARDNLYALTNSISLAQNEKASLESQIRILRKTAEDRAEESKSAVAKAADAVKNPKLIAAETLLENRRTALANLRVQYQETYPLVRNTKAEVDNLQADVDKLRKEDAEKPSETTSPGVALGAQRLVNDTNSQVAYITDQIKVKDNQIANYEKSQHEIQASLSTLNSRVLSMPVGDQRLTELLRDESMAKDEYQKSEMRYRAAKTGSEIEDRKQGELLEQLDAPSVPQEPTYPNRPLVVSIGAGLGLVLGIVLAGAREIKDTSLKNLKDVRAYTQMSILGSVPLLENDFVVRRRRRIAWLGWTAACLIAALMMAGAITYYFQTRG